MVEGADMTTATVEQEVERCMDTAHGCGLCSYLLFASIRKFFRRLYAVVVVTSVASCSHGHAINCHIRRGCETDHNLLDDCNLVVFSLYIHSSVYNFFTSL